MDREFEDLVRDLRADDDEVRRLAVERCAVGESAEATEMLVSALGDPSWRVRKAALERIAALRGRADVVEALLAALADGDNPGRRNAALEALMHCGEHAVPALLRASEDPDVDVRKQVVDALAGIAEPASRARLGELLADEDPNVRGAAADALGAIGDPADAPVLRELQQRDDERLVRLSALRALARVGVAVPAAELLPALDDGLLRAAVYPLLAACDDTRADEAILKGLVDGTRSSRRAAALALVDRVAAHGDREEALALAVRECLDGAPEVYTELLEGLRDAPAASRIGLVQFMGVVRRMDSVVAMISAATDEALEEAVLATLEGFGPGLEAELARLWPELPARERGTALRLLGQTSGAEGSALLRRVLGCSLTDERIGAAQALGARGDAKAIPDLVRALEEAAEKEEADPDLGEALGDALGAISQEPEAARAAVARLAERLPSAGEAFRVEAAHVLGEVAGEEDAGQLAFLLSDPSGRVRRAAAAALGRVARGRTPEALRLALADESPAVRIGAAAAVAASGDPRGLDDLGSLAGDEDERVRAAAMRAVGKYTAERPGPPTVALALLATGVAEGGAVALASLESLALVGGSDAAHVAAPLLEDDDAELVAGAAAVVGRNAEESALASLFPVVSHPHWSARAAAVQALAERGVERALPALLRRLDDESDEFVREALLAAIRRLER